MPRRTAKKKTPPSTFLVLRDQQEKNYFWDFPPTDRCLGTKTIHLPTADYTVEGLEQFFLIERKANVGEFAQNLYQDRFHRELDRMDQVEHPYLFLEFNARQLIEFPIGSGIPQHLWKKLRSTPASLLKAVEELQLAHPRLRIRFVGSYGPDIAFSVMKRMVELHAALQQGT